MLWRRKGRSVFVCDVCLRRGVSTTAGASEAEEHTFPKEPILANGSQCIRQHPCSYVIDWLRWECASQLTEGSQARGRGLH